MKTGYEKPQIQFENFELSQSISAGCELISNQAQYSCSVPVTEPGWGTVILYMDEDGGCTTTPANPGAGDGLCYHAPSDNNNVYSS